MATYISKLGDTNIILEAAAAGGLSKGGDSQIEGSPIRAAANMIKTAVTMSAALSRELGPMARGLGAAVEAKFAVRADGNGIVMVSENINVGQLQISLKISPSRPGRPGPRPKRPPQPRPKGAPGT